MASQPPARSSSRSLSPNKRRPPPLAGIPEAPSAFLHPRPAPPVPTGRPGPNAFAQRAVANERHHLESNAFYQEQVRRNTRPRVRERIITPPTMVHPALRQDFELENSMPFAGETGTEEDDDDYCFIYGFEQLSPIVHEPCLLTSGLGIRVFNASRDFDRATTSDPDTTMSDFIDAEPSAPTPPLKLLPEDDVFHQPTDRGLIEGRREQLTYEQMGGDPGRVPTYKYTPKVGPGDFSKSVGHEATPKKKLGGIFDWAIKSDNTSTPKSRFMEKLRLVQRAAPPPPAPALPRGYGGGEIPPKAKAVLDVSPYQAKVARSPSKKLGFFSRKQSELPPQEAPKPSVSHRWAGDAPRMAYSAGRCTGNFSDSTGRTPHTVQTAFSDPSHEYYGYAHRGSQTQPDQGAHMQKDVKGKGVAHPIQEDYNDASRVASHAHLGQHAKTDAPQGAVFRNPSLQYFDSTVPPTPPEKNTPPEIRAERERTRQILEDHQHRSEKKFKDAKSSLTPKREVEQKPSSKHKSPLDTSTLHKNLGRVYKDHTPSRHEGQNVTAKLKGIDGRTSPTKGGGYARKDIPKLVSQPSMHSLHGSFYPNIDKRFTKQEVKDTTDGLGLEGLLEVPEKYYQEMKSHDVYSPSMYSTNVGATPATHFPTSPGLLFQQSPSLPTGFERLPREAFSSPFDQYEAEIGDSGTTAAHPKLTKMPHDRRGILLEPHGRSTSDAELPVYGRTPHEPTAARAHHYEDRPARIHGHRAAMRSAANQGATSRTHLSSLASNPAPGKPTSTLEDVTLSPPNYQGFPSAVPPPLQRFQGAPPQPLQYLPATTYVPPAKDKGKKKKRAASPTPSQSDIRLGLEAFRTGTPTLAQTPKRKSDTLFDALPAPPPFVQQSDSPPSGSKEPSPKSQALLDFIKYQQDRLNEMQDQVRGVMARPREQQQRATTGAVSRPVSPIGAPMGRVSDARLEQMARRAPVARQPLPMEEVLHALGGLTQVVEEMKNESVSKR